MSNAQIFVYRNQDGRLVKLVETPGESNHSFVGVDVADINENGKAEIFVTNLNTLQDVIESFVLEWNGSDFVSISEKENWYYRVLELPDQGTTLLGQKRGIRDPFLRGIHELAWKNGAYESVGIIPAPKGINMLGFAVGDVMSDGNEMILAFDENDHLQLLNHSGSQVWKSDEEYGGSVSFLKAPAADPASNKESEMDRIYLGQRIFVRDLNQDGKKEVIVVKNQGTGFRLFKRLRHFSSSEIVSLSWDRLGLVLNWKTRKISGYVSDYAIADFDNDGKDEMVAVVVMKQGDSLLVKAKSAIISYNLVIPEG